MKSKRLGIAGLMLAIALLATGGAPGYAQGDEAKELKKIAYLDDPLERIAAVEKYLAEKSASPLAPAARLVLVRALVEAHLPARRVADATKQFLASAPTVDASEIEVRAQLTAFAIDYALALEGGVAPAREIAEAAAKKGDARAMAMLGLFYQKGLGVEADLNKAVDWYAQAGEKGDKRRDEGQVRIDVHDSSVRGTRP